MGYTQTSGKEAEDLAYQYLHKQGLRLLERNFNSRYGEIDLVMRDKDTTVFVEVRYRKHADFVDPLTSVDHRKQSKLIRTAQHYLQRQKNFAVSPARFDVIAITGEGAQPAIQWIKNAFDA